MKRIALLLLAFFCVSSAYAVDEEMLFILRQVPAHKLPTKKADKDVMVLEMPTDDELLQFKKIYAGKDTVTRLDRRDNELFLLENVSKDTQNIDEFLESKGLEIDKPTLEEIRYAKHSLDTGLNFFNRWELQLGVGGVFPLSPQMAQAYYPGFTFDVGFGYQFSKSFVLLLDIDGYFYNPNNPPQNAGYQLNYVDIALLGKWRLTTEGIRPYLFAGPAVGGAEFIQTTTNGNYSTSTIYQPGGADFLLKAGAGFEIPIVPQMYLFLQGQYVWDFANPSWTSFTGVDNTIGLLPVQFGVILSR